jgi:hypothetical protein
VAARPGTQPDPHPGRPPSLHHGERHLTDSEPESGGEQNARFIAARVTEAAQGIGAHIVLGAGDRHVLEAVGEHLSGSLGPVIVAATGPLTRDSDDQPVAEAELNVGLENALRDVTATAADAIGDLVAAAAAATDPDPGAVRGVEAVTGQLAIEQVAVLLVAADAPDDGAALVWAALHQDAIALRLPDRDGVLEGQPVAALLRHGLPRHRA